MFLMLPEIAIGQESCGTKPANSSLDSQPSILPCNNLSGTDGCPANNAPMLYVAMNFHFFLDLNGQNNFNEINDGDPQGTAPYSGYQRAEDLVKEMNRELEVIDNVWPSSLNIATCNSLNIRIVLKGVYFHRVKDNTDGSLWNTIGSYSGYNSNEYNISVMHIDGLGGATWYGDNKALMEGVCEEYLKEKEKGFTAALNPADGTDYSTFGAARTVLHELFHTPGLFHPRDKYIVKNGVLVLSPNDCEDTPKLNCWEYDITKPPCDDWNNIDNNVLNYNSYRRWSLTPCQICTIYSAFAGSSNAPYDQSHLVTQIGGCLPNNAFFTLPKEVCTQRGGANGNPILLDGRASFNETKYQVEIYETDAIGSTSISGHYFSQSFDGEIGIVNLRKLYDFEPNKIYSVKLTTGNACADNTTLTKYISVNACRFIGDPTDGETGGEIGRISIYPNPAIDVIHIRYTLTETTPVTYELLETMSNTPIRSTEREEDNAASEHIDAMPIEGLPSGQYFLKIYTNQTISVHRVVILHD